MTTFNYLSSSGLERLREALEYADAGHITLTTTAHHWALNEIHAAARRFLALTETRQRVVENAEVLDWIEVHFGHYDWETAVAAVDDLIPKLQADYLTEDTR